MVLIFTTFALAFSAFAAGPTSCLPGYTALQAMQSVRDGDSFNHSLESRNSSGPFTTHAQLVGKVAQGSLNLSVRFDPDFEGVSLPYNLYAVSVIADGQPVAWFDFTRSCESAGIGFFPGRVIQLPPVKLLGAPTQKLQIMVWGKL